MQAQSLFDDVKDLQAWHLKVLEGFEMFCKVAWQMSSPRMRLRYPVFELNSLDFSHQLHMYNDFTEEKVGHSDIIDMLDEMFAIRDFYTDTFTGPRQAGRVLRYASFAACHMGAPANRGDLELYLRIYDPYYKSKEGSPLSWLRAFDAGIRRPLLNFLNARLADSIQELEAFKIANGIPETIAVPQIIFRDEEECWAVDYELMSIRYHLLISLLALVEPAAGMA